MIFISQEGIFNALLDRKQKWLSIVSALPENSERSAKISEHLYTLGRRTTSMCKKFCKIPNRLRGVR